MKEHTDASHQLRLITAFSAATFVFSVFGYVSAGRVQVNAPTSFSVSKPAPMAAQASRNADCSYEAGQLADAIMSGRSSYNEEEAYNNCIYGQ